MSKLNCRVKFYADTPSGDVNRLFTWQVGGIRDAGKCVARFQNKGFRIRAVYFEYLNEQGLILENFRIPKEVLYT